VKGVKWERFRRKTGDKDRDSGRNGTKRNERALNGPLKTKIFEKLLHSLYGATRNGQGCRRQTTKL